MHIPNFVRYRLVLSLSIVLGLLLLLSISVQAQPDTTISISIPSYAKDAYEDAIFEFETQNQGVRVHIKENEDDGAFYYSGETASYLDNVASYAETADVLFINSELRSEATRARYFLDMSPLVNTDTTLDVNDFYPALWDAFHWDGGIWGIPIAGDVIGLFYDPQAFGDAGLTYPNENWSVADFAFAAETLAEFNASGEIVVPGFLNIMGSENNFGILLISMLGDDVIDDSIIPNVPDFSNSEIESLLTAWIEIGNTGAMNFPDGGFDFDNLPFSIGPTWIGMSFGNANVRLPAPFPGGGIGVEAQGFAISAGTQNPELSYELIKFLTNSPIIAETFFTETPALRSLADIETDDDAFFEDEVSPELDAFIQRGLENGISPSHARFSHYLGGIVLRASGGGVNAQQELINLASIWVERLRTADERGATTDFTVIPPPPPPVLADGEDSLSFQLDMDFTPLPNEAEWQTFIDDFAASEPAIGFVDLDTGSPDDINEMIRESDCFYSPYNIVPSINTTTIVSLDPLMFADPNVDINDFLPNVLSLVSRDDLMWGFPITLEPLMMNYNSYIFTEAGVPLPENGWTIDEFELAIRDLDSYVDEDAYPFESRTFDNSYLLSLIAAYGGIPVDTRTTPATYNFTDSSNVDAIQQVLNLITDGYIQYSELTNFGGGSFSFNEMPIYAETLDGSYFAFSNEDFQNSYRFTTFPAGSQYSAVTFNVGAAFISANTPHIEACYRLISQMASRPDLFFSMPARQSLINAPEIASAQGQDAVNFYNNLTATMQDSNTIIMTTASSAGRFFESYWLNRVFDQYVAGDVLDLTLALAEAEQYTLAFQECTADILPYQDGIDDPETYFNQYRECATSTDPTSASYFNF